MFDTGTHQGLGLRGFAEKVVPRVVAIASHGDQDGELPLLWDLCSTYTGLSYPVAVIDATTFESEANPGLEQLLDQGYWKDDAGGSQSAWPVIPAAKVLGRSGHLAKGATPHLNQIKSALQNYSVVLIYARPDILLPLLSGSGLKPLLAVSAARMSRVTAYQALKLLLLNGKLHPTIVAMVHEHAAASDGQHHDLCKNLQDCAMAFLGYQLDTLTVRVQRPEAGGYSSDMHTLALHLLETALPSLERESMGGGSLAYRPVTSELTGKH